MGFKDREARKHNSVVAAMISPEAKGETYTTKLHNKVTQ